MIDLLKTLAQKPERVSAAYFTRLARALLQRTVVTIGAVPYRLAEIEFYYNGGDHRDPFAHCEPAQQTQAQWYFHRSGGGYRGGSFKGLDITFGPPEAFCGILIRSLSGPGDTFINGPSLCVDHILKRTGFSTVPALDAVLREARVDDVRMPLRLKCVELEARPIYATARVGLTLKRAVEHPEMPRYILRSYRFLNAPRAIKKGRLHLIIALHHAGQSAAEISALTGTPGKTVKRYLEELADGAKLEGFEPYVGKALDTCALCRLHGTWHEVFSPAGASLLQPCVIPSR